MILCGGFQKSIQRKSGFLWIPNPLLKTLQKVFKGVGGSVFIHQLKAVKPRAVRVYMAARSRVARRVASTVRPCCLMFSKRDLLNLRPWYGRTGPRGRAQHDPRDKSAPRPIRGRTPSKKNLYVSMRSAKKSALIISNGTRPPPHAATTYKVKTTFSGK